MEILTPDKVIQDLAADTVDPATREIAMSVITITVGEKKYSLEEYETLRDEGKIKSPEYTLATKAVNNARNTLHNTKRKSVYPAGLGADDRAGLAMLWLLRDSGHSILICDVEEVGGVGAKSAAKDLAVEISQHQFAIEIDRNGDQEMVFYDVSSQEFETFMRENSGFAIRTGSYTDIKDVCKAGGICGVNMAAGYLFQHSDKEMFFLDFWYRTWEVVKRLAESENLPRFELPKAKPAALVSSTNANAGRTAEENDFEEYYGLYEKYQEQLGNKGPKNQNTPIHMLHKVNI
jgi:hypothetical protein